MSTPGSMGSGRPDDGRHALVLLPSTTAATTGGAHRAAAAAGLPVTEVRELARLGLPIVAAREVSPHAAERRRDQLAQELGVEASVGAASIGAVAGWTGLAVLGVVGELGVMLLAMLFGWGLFLLAGAVLCGLAVVAGAVKRRQAADEATKVRQSEARRLQAEAHQAPQAAAWEALRQVRLDTLQDDLPPGAAADLWAALEQTEAAWLRAGPTEQSLAELQAAHQALGSLAATPAHDPAEQLRRAAAAARSATRELGGG